MADPLTVRQRRVVLACSDGLWRSIDAWCVLANSRAPKGARKADKYRPTPMADAFAALHSIGFAEYRRGLDRGDTVMEWRLTDAGQVLAAELRLAGTR
jgi:hypothetical protein